MKSIRVDDFIGPSLGLVLVLGLLNLAVTAGDNVQFSLPDGDSITCIPFGSQKSFMNQTPPSTAPSPSTTISPGNSTDTTNGVEPAQQTIALNTADACPDGTIPTRQSRGSWGPDESRVIKRRTRQTSPQSQKATSSSSNPPHEYAIATVDTSSGILYKGTEVLINVWDPQVESSQEFSLAQLWVSAKLNDNDGTLNTVEAGYQVSTGHYGDALPRLFVYWTADDYKTTGCYDLDCPGFVQVSNKVLIGGSFATISSTGAQQYEVKLLVFKDDQTGDWWLQVNDETVGYWQQNIFTQAGLQGMAQLLEWGGEIVDDESHDGGHHTTTQMGSGAFASAGFSKAAYIRNMQYIDQDDTLADAPFTLFNTSSNCYSALPGSNTFPQWSSYFFYGGQGYSTTCQTHTEN